MNHYVLVYGRSTGKLQKLYEYGGGSEAATAARARLEIELRDDPDIEVVMLGADSEEALRRTHSRYFKSAAELATAE